MNKEDIKVLFIHCYYNKWGGEDVTFEAERKLFPNRIEYIIQNKSGVRGLFQFLFSVWNFKRAKEIEKIVDKEKPDIIHVYNFHFGIGPLFIRRLKKRFKTPVIATVQNFRLLCPSATFLIKGRLNTNSLKEAFPWNAISKGAYRNSVLLTFYLGLITWIHTKLRTWNKLDLILLQTEFAKQLFLSGKLNLNNDQVVVKPNGIEGGKYIAEHRNNRFLFVGRISVEKGIQDLLELFSNLPYELDVVGEGPLLETLQKRYSSLKNIVFHGKKGSLDVKKLMQSSSALLFPSIWYEGMPLTILEAFASGTPVFSSAIGAMNYLIEHNVNGFLVETGNGEEWRKCLREWYEMPNAKKQSYSENARKIFLEMYSSECNEKKLLELYNSFFKENLNVHLIKKSVPIV